MRNVHRLSIYYILYHIRKLLQGISRDIPFSINSYWKMSRKMPPAETDA